MLKFMRKYATSYMIKGMFGLIIVVFVFWGVGSFRGDERTVAEVGSHKVSFTEYQETYNRLMNMYRMIYKEKFDENVIKEIKLKERAMDEIVDKYILRTKAKELDITISDKEFNDHLTGIDAFKRDGKFNEKIYVEVLKRNGIDPKRFEESEKIALINAKMANLIRDNGVYLSDADIWAGYVREKGKVNLAYVQFDPSEFKDKASVDEKELQDMYEKEKGGHRGENLYRLKYIVLGEKSSIKDDAAYLDLLKMKDIGVYGKQNIIEVVDLGYVKESELFNRFKSLRVEEWIKGLKKGDISLPIRDGSKSYIFQLVDSEEGKPTDKSIALKTIRERIMSEKAKTFAKAKAEDTIAKKSIDSKKDTGFISRNNYNIPKIGVLPKEHFGVLALSKNRQVYEKPVEIAGIYYIFSFKAEKLPEQQEWEKEKESYTQYLMTKNREEFLKSFVEELRMKEKIKILWQDI